MPQSWLEDLENKKIYSRNGEPNPGPSSQQPTRSQFLDTVAVQGNVQSTTKH